MDWLLAELPSNDRTRFTQTGPPKPKDVGKLGKQHLRPLHKALDTSIMEIADDIAYGVHNLEDAIALRLVTRDEWKTLEPSFDTHGQYS